MVVTVMGLAQTSNMLDPNVRRVGEKLACLCGGCKNSVGSCPMLRCESATPKRAEIKSMLDQGKTDQEIVDRVVREEGIRALVTPPAVGFNRMMWLMPFFMIAAGLMAIWFFVQHMRSKRLAAEAPQLEDEVLQRYHEQIEKETSKLE